MTRLGKHFLRNEEILEKLVDLADVKPDDVVLEPGCGDGLLTEKIAKRGCTVIAVEIDEELARKAAERVKTYSNVKLLVGDLLKIKPTGFNKVIGNPPYYLSSRLLQWLITGPMPELIVMTLQREFAEKLSSKPKQDNYVYVSVLSQLFYSIEIHGTVPRQAFKPPPRVSSKIVIMRRIPITQRNLINNTWLLKHLFTKKRHLVSRELKRLGIETPPQLVGKRIYEIDVKDYYDLLSRLTA
jgi:ribosomal RNA small subunit methyltransferase A